MGRASRPATCPPRETTVTGEQSNTRHADRRRARRRSGSATTLTIPQTNANGTITNTTRVITNIAGNTLTLATAVATAAGQQVVNGAVVSLACGNANPTPYAEWPDPTTGDADAQADRRAALARGGLTFAAGSGGHGDADRRRRRRRRRR